MAGPNSGERIIFAVSTDVDTPVVILAIPTAAWEYMKDGKTHTFDLAKIGLPVRLVLFGAKDAEVAMAQLQADLASKNVRPVDARSEDFSIGGKRDDGT